MLVSVVVEKQRAIVQPVRACAVILRPAVDEAVQVPNWGLETWVRGSEIVVMVFGATLVQKAGRHCQMDVRSPPHSAQEFLGRYAASL